MDTLLLAGTSALVIGVGVGAPVGTPFLVKWLAGGDTFFTTIREGSVKAVVRSGDLDHFLISSNTHHLNDPRKRWFDRKKPLWEVIPHNAAHAKRYQDRGALTYQTGTYYVGLYPFRKVYKYRFVWNKPGKDKEGHPCIIPRNDMTDFIYIRDYPYAIVAKGEETKDGLPLDAVLQVMIRITNPDKALFKTTDWMAAVHGEVTALARNLIGKRTFDELKSELDEKAKQPGGAAANPDSFTCPIVELTDEIPSDSPDTPEHDKGLKGRYGVTIVSANLLRLDIVGEVKAKLAEASTLVYTATQRAESLVIEKNAEAEGITAVGTAESNVIVMKGRAQARSLLYRLAALQTAGRLGELLAQLDAMQAPGEGKTVIWAQQPWLRGFDPELPKAMDAAGLATTDEAKVFFQGILDDIMNHGKKDEAA